MNTANKLTMLRVLMIPLFLVAVLFLLCLLYTSDAADD